MTAALDEALRLCSGGIPVFPCWPDGYGSRPDGRPYYKSPRIAGWQLYASADESIVRGWFTQWPDSLVGVPCGGKSGLYVLDLDVKPEQEVSGVASLVAAGISPPPTRINHTLSGGMHLLYLLPETGAAHTDAGMIGPGVDRRGDGGYIIWWPAHGGAVTHGAIAPCPQWMVGAVRGDGPSDTHPPMGLTEHEIHDLLRRIQPADVAGRSEWLRVGMALHHEYEGDERGLTMWNAYSMLWPNYDGEHVLRREWDTFGRTARVAVTLRSYVPSGWKSVPPDVAFAGGQVVVPAPVTQAATSLPFFVPNLPMAVVDARDGTSTTRPLTEAGNAMRMHDKYSSVLRYVVELDEWLYWHDSTWQVDTKASAVRHLATLLGGDVYAEGGGNINESPTYVKWARKCSELRTATNTVTLLSLYPDMRISAADLDTDQYLCGLNGARSVLDLRTGQVRAALPGDYITKSLGVSAVGQPGGSARWLSFVSEIFCSDQHLADWIQRWCGYNLSGSTREEIMVFAYGQGRNGKGTFFESIARVLGEYVATVPSSTFDAAHGGGGGEGATPQLAKLQGARMVLSSETNADTPVNESLIKSMTGGDAITARPMYASPITFYPQFKITVQGNHKPMVRGMDVGVWSRIKLVPFLRIFSDEERDRSLKARFRDDAEHILAWMLEGCLRWQEMGLSDVPVAISSATAAYREEMDVMGEWIRERCVERSDVSAMASVLYASYRDWAEKNGYKAPMTSNAFGRRLSDRGIHRQRIASGSLWKGLSLRM